MNIKDSILARIDSLKQTRKSKYWLYNKYFEDDVLWDNTILSESFGGSNFQGNPYYMFRYFFKAVEFQEFQFIICHKKPEELNAWLLKRKLLDNRVRIVEIGAEDYIDALCHSKYLINNVGFNMNFIKKQEQVYVNTWHGTPLKTLGRDVHGDPFAVNNSQRNMLMADILVAPNELTRQVYLESHMVHNIQKGETILMGYPRNSIFLDEVAADDVKKKYHLEHKKTLLYMPTWRGNTCRLNDVDQISEMERLAKELGDNYKVFVKFHPAMVGKSADFEHCHSIPDDIEVYEFLNAMDMLITDYSSVFFDFAVKNKRILLYQYDKKEYLHERGIYAEVEEQLCFETVYCYDELKSAVLRPQELDYSSFIETFCKYEAIDVPKRLAEMMVSKESTCETSDEVDLYIIDFPVDEETILKWKTVLDAENKNYRFLFMLGSNSWYYKKIEHWNQFDFFCAYYSDGLTLKEKVMRRFSSRLAKKLQDRERHRLWGETTIGHIYSKRKHLPVALCYSVEEWPKQLL